MHKIMYSFSIIAIFYGQRAEPISVWRIPLPMSTVCTNNSIKCLFLILCDFLTRFSFLVVEKTKNKSFFQQFFNNFVYFLVYPPFVQCKKQSKQKKLFVTHATCSNGMTANCCKRTEAKYTKTSFIICNHMCEVR